MAATLDLATLLVARPSLTPHDHDCQALLVARLHALGFICETMASHDVLNLWAVRPGRDGKAGKRLAFAGHTDVVPTGPLDAWTCPPFLPTLRDGKLYGRGAADMKASLAAFVVATEEFVAETPAHRGTVASC